MFYSTGGVAIFEQWWLPEGDTRGVVALVHGFGEHSGRYAHVGSALNARGYAVEAIDLRGHGRSEGPRTLVGSANEYLIDVGHLLRRARERHPGAPLFLLGHSMGGGIAALYAITRRPQIDGLILSGPALGGQSVPLPARLLLRLVARVRPDAGMFQLDATAISRDEAVVAAYLADPLVDTGKMKAGLLAALLRAQARIGRDMEDVTQALLVMHGSEDRLTRPSASEELVARANTPDKTLKLYQGLYHEIFNEPEQAAVLSDLADWLDRHTSRPGEQA